jgi:ribose-phosphate pyrophosphokinase
VKIFSGTSNRPSTFAERFAPPSASELGKSTIKPFPDGETFVKIEENVRGEDVSWCSPPARRPTIT